MAPPTAHRLAAVATAALDGLLVGGAEAALDLPPRSWARGRVYLALTAAVAAETVVREFPTLRRAVRGLPVLPDDPRERAVQLERALLTTGWGLVVTVADGPLARELRRQGVARPHLLLGVLTGALAAASTLPALWQLASERIEEVRATASLDEELAELLGQPRD